MQPGPKRKRKSDLAKHGVDLALAGRFDFESALVEEDRDARGEQRFRAIGWIDNRLCYLVYTERGDEMHAISLRPVTPQERRHYEKEKRL